ncbi:MAG: Asp-tRNA(Asn)/Glu-tRNA(Gln) amidotransferase subunit GatC [Bacteroidia bacterium]|nr:Asp-tRNA(Asn)/Glu-tRNA(Gln) amidotransferase subunit GatC [Bacteroidia bacterium]
MNVNEALLVKLASLARLEIPEESKEGLLQDLQQMLDFVEHLQEVEVEGVSPMISPGEAFFNGVADIPEPPLDRERMLGQAPDRHGPFFRLPKVVNKDV